MAITWLKRVGVLCLFGTFVLNGMAFMHAKSMLEFSDSSGRTQRPEDLTLLSKLKVLLAGVTIPRPEIANLPDQFELEFEIHKYNNFREELLEAWYIPASKSDTVFLLFHGCKW